MNGVRERVRVGVGCLENRRGSIVLVEREHRDGDVMHEHFEALGRTSSSCHPLLVERVD